MSDEIKVGDVCIIVAPASHALVGSECEVIGEEKVYEKKIADTPSFEMVAWCRGFLVRMAVDGRRYCIDRQCLRKKRPPADENPDQLGDESPNKCVNWSQVPGFRPPTRVKEPA